MVKIIVHRGFSGNYLEYTEIAFVKALSLSVDMVEYVKGRLRQKR